MRNFKTEVGPVTLDYREPPSAGGGAITFFPPGYSIGLGDNSGSSLSSAYWMPRVSMNLVRFEMSGEWSAISLSPLYIQLIGDSGVLAEIELTGTESTYEFWTGSVAVEAGDSLWCYVYGGGITMGEDYFNASAFGLCITAWFDGEAGGGIALYADPGA